MNLLSMFGGLALFLYGMKVMGESLSEFSESKMHSVLERLTAHKYMSVLSGIFITAIIQSSSASTVIVVNLVDSGMIKLGQAAEIIMGTNIGTTVTAWLLALTGIKSDNVIVSIFSPDVLVPVLITCGIILMYLFGNRYKNVAQIIIGFCILMYGMEKMSGAVSGLVKDDSFAYMMIRFDNPIFGLCSGLIVTMIIQSSSASVGILQSLCISGVITYRTAIPVIMGQNIGTCITGLISCIGTCRNAKRAAIIHLYFNMIGTMLFMGLYWLFCKYCGIYADKAANALDVALIHSIFNVSVTIVLYPVSGMLVKLARITIPVKRGE